MLILSPTRTTQPQQPARPESAFRASRVWTPTTGEVVAGSVPTTNRTDRTATVGGIGARFNGSTSERLQFAAPQSTGDMTLVAVFVPFSTGNQVITGLFRTAAGNDVASYIAIEGGTIRTWCSESANWTDANGPTAVAGRLYSVVSSFVAGGGRRMFINGAFAAESTLARNPANLDAWTSGLYVANTAAQSPFNGALLLSAVLPYAAQEVQALSLSRNPWQLFAPEPRRIWVPVAAGGVSGTSATTNANDTSSASGSPIIVGTSARTNANDTSTASGTPIIVGTSARTNANDTSSASGTVGGGVSGTSATTNANDTSAASGSPIVNGTSTTTNAADTASAAGWAGNVSGTVAVTNRNDTAAAEGFIGAEAPRRNTGAGKSKRRRYTVEVDGEEFDVASPAEAEAVLAQVREQAEQTAAVALERAKAAEKRPTRKVLADARKALVLPDIKVPDEMQARVQATLESIEALYQSTLQTIEIAALLRKRQQEEEDDEDILLLIA